jgi:hypothetical protein
MHMRAARIAVAGYVLRVLAAHAASAEASGIIEPKASFSREELKPQAVDLGPDASKGGERGDCQEGFARIAQGERAGRESACPRGNVPAR